MGRNQITKRGHDLINFLNENSSPGLTRGPPSISRISIYASASLWPVAANVHWTFANRDVPRGLAFAGLEVRFRLAPPNHAVA
jgi:hypothetical protein